MYCRDRSFKSKLTAVHLAYACEATMAKEPVSSGTGSMEEQVGPTSSIPNVWVM